MVEKGFSPSSRLWVCATGRSVMWILRFVQKCALTVVNILVAFFQCGFISLPDVRPRDYHGYLYSQED